MKQDLRPRPSIELSPSLELPVLILTQNLTSTHILKLIEEFDKFQISYQMNQDSSVLDVWKNKQKLFVIVDTRNRQIKIQQKVKGTLIGYPKMGKNKMDTSCETAQQVVKMYHKFVSLKISNRNLLEKQKSEKMKIQLRSIEKFNRKAQNNNSQTVNLSNSTSSMKKQSKIEKIKLIIVKDSHEPAFQKFCELIGEKQGLISVEKVENLEGVRRKSLYHTKNTNFIYLVNNRYYKDVLDIIFIGEVLIVDFKKQIQDWNQVLNMNKVYGIAFEKDQLINMMKKLGVYVEKEPIIVEKYSLIVEKDNIPELSQQNYSDVQTVIEHKVEDQPMSFMKKQQMSQISQLHSRNPSIENNSQLLHASGGDTLRTNNQMKSNSSVEKKKIKRIKGLNKKLKSRQNLNSSKQYSQISETKQNIAVNKPILKKQQINSNFKTKKSLKFGIVLSHEKINEQSHQQSYRQFNDSTNRISTKKQTIKMDKGFQYYQDNQQQYIQINNKPQSCKEKLSSNQMKILKNTQLVEPLEVNICPNLQISAVLYKQFNPTFIKVIEQIKSKKESSVFKENQNIWSYFKISQYDRYVRRIKRQQFERNKGHNCVFNFVVFAQQEELEQFLEYFEEKNEWYKKQQPQETFNTNFMSEMNKQTVSQYMNIFMFIPGNFEPSSAELEHFNINLYPIKEQLSSAAVIKTLRQVW